METGYDEIGLTINDEKVNREKPDYFYNPWTGTPFAHMSIRYFLDKETPLYTGTGSYNDSAVCSTFASLKAAMENSGVQYVLLKGGSLRYKVDTIPETEDGKIRDAVWCEGKNKFLILEGKTEFRGPATSNSLINLSIGNRLTITGDGALAYWHENYHEESAVVHLNRTGAQLTVEDGVTLVGLAKQSGTHGRAIYANLTVNGGYISTSRDDKQCESALYLDTTGTVNLREGKFLEADIVIVPNTRSISGSGYFVNTIVKTNSGSGLVELTDWTQPVSVLEGKTVELSFTKFINVANVTVTDPVSGQAPDMTSFTVGNTSYTVD